MRMRVMVFGREMMIQRLTTSLAGEGIEVVHTKARLEPERFDLAVVDSSVEEADIACRYIKELGGIPVVLIVRERHADWERLQSLDSDGYIPERMGAAELAARLRAVVRRRSEWENLSFHPLTLGVWKNEPDEYHSQK